jgi:hypothetical protein
MKEAKLEMEINECCLKVGVLLLEVTNGDVLEQ